MQIDFATTAARRPGKVRTPYEKRRVSPRREDCGRDEDEPDDVRHNT